MVKIYTKKGDDGSTGLIDGSRVQKNDPRVDAYGDIDELNALLGTARAFVEEKEINKTLEKIQSNLFAMGAQLADPHYDATKSKEKTKIQESAIRAFEEMMDRYENDLPPLKGFILPCGTPSASFLHLARTVCRRAERKMVGLGKGCPPILLTYINRLSDLLFTLARVENLRGGEEQVPW